MVIGNRQIGWSQEDNLLWEISRQLDRMNSITCTGPCSTSSTTTSTSSTSTSSTTTSTTSSTSTTTTTICLNCVEEPVVIDTQTWDKCNLNVTTYRNGDTIPEVTDPAVWAALTTGAWCHYDNDPLNEPIYGKLYNWYAVNDPRGLAPLGKSIPTNSEFTTLITFLGGESVAGGKMKETGFCHWLAPNTDATNSSGFTGLPGGYRYNDGTFYLIENFGFWWSSSEANFSSDAWALILIYGASDGYNVDYMKNYGLSVRCLIDNTTTTTTTTIPLVFTDSLFEECSQLCGAACGGGIIIYYNVWMTQECIDTFPTIGCAIYKNDDPAIPFDDGTYNLGDGTCIVITGGIITDILT